MTSFDPGWRILRQIDDVPPVPWANGAGTTRELVGYVESAALTPGTARWRLSIALLERVGAFSPLPGIDRTFLLVGGDAELSVDGVRHRLGHGDILRFRGDQAVVLESLGAPCHAVNLMVEQADAAPAPQLRGGPLTGEARFAVALQATPDIAEFDLIEHARGEGAAPALPDEAASIIV